MRNPVIVAGCSVQATIADRCYRFPVGQAASGFDLPHLRPVRGEVDPERLKRLPDCDCISRRDNRLVFSLLGTNDHSRCDRADLSGKLAAAEPEKGARLADLAPRDHLLPTFRRPSPVRMKARAGGTRRVSVRLVTCRRLSRCAKRDRTSPGRRRQAAWISAAVAWVRSNKKVRIRMSGEVRRVVTRSLSAAGDREVVSCCELARRGSWRAGQLRREQVDDGLGCSLGI